MTFEGNLRDTEVLVCVLLKERAPLSLKDLGRWVGDLKEAFKSEREKGTLDEALHALEGCVDDVPKAVRILLDRGVVERTGQTPKDWRYKLSASFQSCDLPEHTLEALRSHMERMRPG